MTASLEPAAATLADALRALERCLQESRGQWNDQARQAFDRRYCDRIAADGRRTVVELKGLAKDLAAALGLLDRIE